MSGEPRKMARGMKYMFAITWSVPRPTKHITGNQMETILEMISREEMARKTAMQTSQLPVRKLVVSVVGKWVVRFEGEKDGHGNGNGNIK